MVSCLNGGRNPLLCEEYGKQHNELENGRQAADAKVDSKEPWLEASSEPSECAPQHSQHAYQHQSPEDRSRVSSYDFTVSVLTASHPDATYTGVKLLGGDCSRQAKTLNPNPTIRLATAKTLRTRLKTAVRPVLFIL